MSRSLRPRIEFGASVERQVRMEIRVFLRALETYTALFARHPDITFNEYHARLMRLAGSRPKQRRKSGTRGSR